MFDIGFWEILLIGIVTLLVVGPQRLPGVAVFAGHWIGRIRRFVRNMRDEINEELETEHLKSLVAEQNREISELRRDVEAVRSDTERSFRDAEDQVRDADPSAVEGDTGTAEDEDTGTTDTRSDHDATGAGDTRERGGESGDDAVDADESSPAEDDTGTDERRGADGREEGAR